MNDILAKRLVELLHSAFEQGYVVGIRGADPDKEWNDFMERLIPDSRIGMMQVVADYPDHPELGSHGEPSPTVQDPTSWTPPYKMVDEDGQPILPTYPPTHPPIGE